MQKVFAYLGFYTKNFFNQKLKNFIFDNKNWISIFDKKKSDLFFFKMKLLFIILFHFKGVFYLKANDCSSIVTSDTVVYKGCKEFIETDSLTNSAKDSIPIFSFKVFKKKKN